MKHIILLISMAITCLLVAVANVIVDRMVGINIFTFKFWLIIPAGAFLIGMLGASGAILAARYFNIQPTIIDAMLMVIIAAATMILIYYLEYTTLVLDDGRKASDLIDFTSFVDLVLTKSHMIVCGAQTMSPEVGQLGYAFALIEFLGFLAGGASTFFIIKRLPRCVDCGGYLKRNGKPKELEN